MQKTLHDICKRCIHNYTKKMAELGMIPEGETLPKWQLPCKFVFNEDIDPKLIMERAKEQNLTPEETLDLVYMQNPVLFSNEVLRVDPFEYQKEFLLCNSRKIVKRMSRRLGKTSGMCIKIIHFGMFNKKSRIIVFAPFQKQVEKIFEEVEKLLRRGGDYTLSRIMPVRNSQRLYKKNPLELTFTSGTVMVGSAIGIQNNEKSVSLRGEGVKDYDGVGGLVIGDEIDFLMGKSWEVVNPIINEPGSGLTFCASSTPIGKREMFYKMCKGAISKYFKEIYRTIYDYPLSGLKDQTLAEYVELARESCLTEESFIREYLADFGEEVDSEFSYSDLMKCMGDSFRYPKIPSSDNGHPDYTSVREIPNPNNNIRMVGIDWNGDKIGTRFIVVEFDSAISRYKIIGRYSIQRGKFKQIAAIDMVRALNRMFRPKFIYADAGYGHTQVQRLHEISTLDKTKDPNWEPIDRNLVNVKGIEMNGITEMIDKATREIVKKQNKGFMIEIARGLCEEHMLWIPRHEYNTSENIKGGGDTSFNQLRENLVPCLLKFKRVISDKTGRPSWSQEDDHDAIALALALMAFIVETSGMCKGPKNMSETFHNGKRISVVDQENLKKHLETIDIKVEKVSTRTADLFKNEGSRTDFLTETTFDPYGSEIEKPRTSSVNVRSLRNVGRRNPFGSWRR